MHPSFRAFALLVGVAVAGQAVPLYAQQVVQLPDGAISASIPTVDAPLMRTLPLSRDPQNLVRVLIEQGYTDVAITYSDATLDISARYLDVPVRLIYDSNTRALIATGGIHTNP